MVQRSSDAGRVDHLAPHELALEAQVRGNPDGGFAAIDQIYPDPDRRAERHLGEERAHLEHEAADIDLEIGWGDQRRGRRGTAERDTARSDEGVRVVAELLQVVGMERPLDVAGEGVVGVPALAMTSLVHMKPRSAKLWNRPMACPTSCTAVRK